MFAFILHKEEAKELGIKFFFSGRPCKNGHFSPRYTSTHMCLDCRRRHEASRIDNDPDAHREKSRKWHENNRDKSRRMTASYYAKNRHRARVRCRNRWAKKHSGGTHTAEDIASIFLMQSGKCGYCRIKLGSRYHVDHITPLARGGKNDRTNLQILCVPCNQSKSAKDPIVFAQSLGMLL